MRGGGRDRPSRLPRSKNSAFFDHRDDERYANQVHDGELDPADHQTVNHHQHRGCQRQRDTQHAGGRAQREREQNQDRGQADGGLPDRSRR